MNEYLDFKSPSYSEITLFSELETEKKVIFLEPLYAELTAGTLAMTYKKQCVDVSSALL